MSKNTPVILDVVPEAEAELQVVVRQNNLSENVAHMLEDTFSPFFSAAREVIRNSRSVVVTDATQKAEIKQAHEFRIKLKNLRVESEKTKKNLKEESLRFGKAIDGFYNIFLLLVGTEEKRLQAQEDFAALQEAARKAELSAARAAQLQAVGVDTQPFSLGDMEEAAFVQLLEGSRLAWQAKQEALKRAEEERILVELKRQEEEARVREENARLRREAEEREAQARAERKVLEDRLQAEREEQARQRAAAEEIARVEREEAAALRAREEAVRKAEVARLESIAKTEREARERAEAEVRRAREEEERKAEMARLEALRAAQAPDLDNLRLYAQAVRALVLPELKTPAARKVASDIRARTTAFAEYIEKQARTLS
jgi:hypothetical protein